MFGALPNVQQNESLLIAMASDLGHLSDQVVGLNLAIYHLQGHYITGYEAGCSYSCSDEWCQNGMESNLIRKTDHHPGGVKNTQIDQQFSENTLLSIVVMITDFKKFHIAGVENYDETITV